VCESNGQHVLVGPVDQVQVVVIEQIWGIEDALSSVRDVPCGLGLLGLIWAVRRVQHSQLVLVAFSWSSFMPLPASPANQMSVQLQ